MKVLAAVRNRNPGDPSLFLEVAVVILLTIVNGVLAMSELAVVSARPVRLRMLQDQGSSGATAALRLAENPGRFLSTVQIGITLVGILSGAFSGATLGLRLTGWLEARGVSNGVADALGVGSVVMVITYMSLIIGELVPKQIALRDAELVAARVAPAMMLLSRLAYPLVWLLDTSGRIVLRVLGQHGETEDKLTEEELKSVISEAETAGVLKSDEKDMISGVMRLADRTARALMTPRRDVEILDLSHDVSELRELVRKTRRSRLPVVDGSADEIIGVIFVKDLFEVLMESDQPNVRSLIQKAPVVIDSAHALDVLRTIRGTTLHMALVFDEYGHFEGVITSGDVLEAITGVFREKDDEPAYTPRDDGSFLVSGWMPIDELRDKIGMPIARGADFETVAGFVLNELHRMPVVGDRFDKDGWRIEVVDLDGRRIDKLLIGKIS